MVDHPGRIEARAKLQLLSHEHQSVPMLEKEASWADELDSDLEPLLRTPLGWLLPSACVRTHISAELEPSVSIA